MFGVSFGEVVLIAVVALVVVGPRKLPEMLGTLGRWIGRLRTMTTEVRRQTGIDEILRSEGLAGGINELRSLMRTGLPGIAQYGPGAGALVRPDSAVNEYGEAVDFDRYREYPTEGPDAAGAIPEDLLDPAIAPAALAPAPEVAAAASVPAVLPAPAPAPDEAK